MQIVCANNSREQFAQTPIHTHTSDYIARQNTINVIFDIISL